MGPDPGTLWTGSLQDDTLFFSHPLLCLWKNLPRETKRPDQMGSALSCSYNTDKGAFLIAALSQRDAALQARWRDGGTAPPSLWDRPWKKRCNCISRRPAEVNVCAVAAPWLHSRLTRPDSDVWRPGDGYQGRTGSRLERVRAGPAEPC